MSKKQALLEYYSNVLLAMDCVIDENGFVSYRPQPTIPAEPITILNGMRLAVPTDYVMKHLFENEIVAFHPLSEVIVLGQSAVIQTTRQIANASLTNKILSTMLGICTGIAKNATMTAKQTEFIHELDKVDDKTVKSLLKLIDVIDPDSQYRVINMFLKHGGVLHDHQYKRICTVSFPLYQELLSAEDTVYGVKMRKQDIRTLTRLMEILFPRIDQPNAYSYGTDTLVCPYFIAVLHGFKNVVEELNRASFRFKKIIEEYTGVIPHVNVEFIDQIGDGSVFKDIIPPLEHNRGVEQGKKTEPAEVQQAAPPQQHVNVQPAPQPVVQQAPVAQPVHVVNAVPVQQYHAPGMKKPNPYAGLIKNKLGSDVDLNNAKVKNDNNGYSNSGQNDFMNAAYPAAVYGQPVPQAAAYGQYPQYPQYGQYPQYPQYPQVQGVPVAQPVQYPQAQGVPVAQAPQYPQYPQYPQVAGAYPPPVPYGQPMYGAPPQVMGAPQATYQPGSAYPKFK